MICDDCKCKNKCTKIISEGEKYCRDKIVEAILFRIDKDYLEQAMCDMIKVQSGLQKIF